MFLSLEWHYCAYPPGVQFSTVQCSAEETNLSWITSALTSSCSVVSTYCATLAEVLPPVAVPPGTKWYAQLNLYSRQREQHQEHNQHITTDYLNYSEQIINCKYIFILSNCLSPQTGIILADMIVKSWGLCGANRYVRQHSEAMTRLQKGHGWVALGCGVDSTSQIR